jgi:hypothetical protein
MKYLNIILKFWRPKVSRVFVSVVVDLVIDIESENELSHVINEMDYSFSDTTGYAVILDSNIIDYTLESSNG